MAIEVDGCYDRDVTSRLTSLDIAFEACYIRDAPYRCEAPHSWTSILNSNTSWAKDLHVQPDKRCIGLSLQPIG